MSGVLQCEMRDHLPGVHRNQSNTQVFITVWAKNRTEVDTQFEFPGPGRLNFTVEFEDGSRCVTRANPI